MNNKTKWFVWYEEESQLYYAVDTKTERCHGGWCEERQAIDWIESNGYAML